VHQSGTEPTLVARLSRPLTPEEAHDVSKELKQDAIAQVVDGKGICMGQRRKSGARSIQTTFSRKTASRCLIQINHSRSAIFASATSRIYQTSA